MIALCAQDPVACRTQYGDFVEGVTDYRKELDAAFGLDIPPGLKADLAIYLYQHQEAIGVALNTEIAEQLQEKYGLTSEAAAQLAAVGAAAVGVIKGKYQPNAGSVGNMSELMRQSGFGAQIGAGSQKTRQIYQGQSVYQAKGAIGEYISKGDRFYLDALHKNHIEVFDANGRAKAVLNLDGSLDDIKTTKALAEGRKLSKLIKPNFLKISKIFFEVNFARSIPMVLIAKNELSTITI
ncbi:hypothetical protein HRF68_22055, partial [Pseudomonas stutzeri]|nr:hypothetical protein [Stutzerimonas stutzeri]